MFFLLLMLMPFGCYGILSFHRFIMGKKKNGFNCCLISGILTQIVFFLMFVEYSPTKHNKNVVQISSFWFVAMATERLKFCVKLLQLFSQASHCGPWASVFLLLFFCAEKHFSFICKAGFRRATLSCDSSYCISKTWTMCFFCVFFTIE